MEILKKKIYLLVCLLFGATFIASAVGLGFTLYRYRQADEVYEDLQDRFVMVNTGQGRPSSARTSSQTPAVTQTKPAAESKTDKEPGTGRETENAPDIGPETGNEPVTEPVPETEPQTEPEKEPENDQAPILVDFNGLRKINGDIIGWLYGAGTSINYPVVQSSDNEDYLHTDIYGKYLYSGTLFADFRCGAVGSDQIHIIYGHTMKNGSMFGKLNRYKKQSYYEEHPVLYYLTPDQDYRIDLFAGLVIESTSEFYSPNFRSPEDFEAILKKIRAKSTFSSKVTVTSDDHIVMLSSCDYTFNDARYVVFGKLTPLYTP